MAGRFNFPTWNYGYTLGPAAYTGTGDYTQYYQNYYGQPGVHGAIPAGRGRGRGIPVGAPALAAAPPVAPPPVMTPPVAPPPVMTPPVITSIKVEPKVATVSVAAPPPPPPTPAVIKAAPVMNPQPVAPPATVPESIIGPVKPLVTAAPPPPPSTAPPPDSAGNTQLQNILRGRNPVIFCNYQSKLRNLQMEWEQLSESGPPHDKIFEYQLRLGNSPGSQPGNPPALQLISTGRGKSKKDAKTKAAEDMVLKLDGLPKPTKRPMYSYWGRGGGHGGYGGHGGGGHGGGPHNKKRRPDSEDQILRQNDVTPKAVNPSMNNPISLLFEFSKKRRWPEPLFDTISENVLETRKTQQGFTLKKTEFTIRCTVRQQVGQGEDQHFLGTALTKKQAKYNAAAAAWAGVGGEATKATVEKLLNKGVGSQEVPPPPPPAAAVCTTAAAMPAVPAAPPPTVAAPAAVASVPQVIMTTKRLGYARYNRY